MRGGGLPGLLPAMSIAACVMVAAAQDPQRYVERVEVARVIVDVRVTDDSGRPIVGLSLDDFLVKVDGNPVALESARWVSATDDPRADGAPGDDIDVPRLPPGRLIVLFFQKDITLAPSRMEGTLPMLKKAGEFIDRLGPLDRAAVASFDSHLKLWTDFTADHETLKQAAIDSITAPERGHVAVTGSPSIALYLRREECAQAATPEQALAVVGRALGLLPGPKALVVVGFGFGHLRPGAPEVVDMDRDYSRAIAALVAARVTVFSLDVTQADAHSLEVGLRAVAAATGGFYESTYLFPERAVQRLERVLEGEYVLVFEKPSRPPGEHRIRVELVRRKGTVLARTSYIG